MTTYPRRDALLTAVSGHGIAPVTDPTGTTPTPRRFPVELFAEFNAGTRRAANGAAERKRCGRCGYPESPTHRCKSRTQLKETQ